MNSTELRGYLTGLILGDAYIDKGVTKRALRLKTINKEWIYKIKEDIDSVNTFDTFVKEFDSYVDKDGVNHKRYYEFVIKSTPYFNKKYNHFYDDYRHRRITAESLKWLNLAGLANWYMSDGYICLVGKTKGAIRSRRVDLCTDRYTYNDIQKIQKYFKEVWGWDTNIIQRKTNGKIMYRLRFSLTSAQDFLYQISPYVVTSYQYKLNLCYDYQPAWMNDNYYNLMNEIQKREHPTEESEE